MKNNLLLLLLLGVILPFFACQSTENSTWADFKKCATNTCVKEAVAVKDAFIKDPQSLMKDFLATYEKGEDHLIGWMYILRDSVLTNPSRGSLEVRMAMRQAIVGAAKVYDKDPKLGEIAKTIINEMESIAIQAETEDVIADEPTLSAQDSVLVANLIGTWQSRDDSKAGVTFTKDKCTFTYKGENPEPSLSYVYYPNCPKDCNPVQNMACLKLTGQDDVCYTVVKADGKVLELSQIGGTGNTNRYIKKK